MDDLGVGLVYVLTALVALSVGVTFAVSAVSEHPRLLESAAILTTVVVVVAAFAAGADVQWMGPIFALVVAVSTVLVSAWLQRDHPALLTESYWRRVLLLMLHPRALRSVARENAYGDAKGRASADEVVTTTARRD